MAERFIVELPVSAVMADVAGAPTGMIDRIVRSVGLPENAPAYIASPQTVGVGVKRLKAHLREHWLSHIVCDHEAKTDTAVCSCSQWADTPHPSVGAAVDAWIDHVFSTIEITPPREQKGQHKWVPSTLGHGETMCEYCKITNREAAVLGELNECSKAPHRDGASERGAAIGAFLNAVETQLSLGHDPLHGTRFNQFANLYPEIAAAIRKANPMTDALTKAQEPELLPCPFCGGPVRLIEGEESAYVQCEQVQMHRALWFEGDNNAAAEVRQHWNRRTTKRVGDGTR